MQQEINMKELLIGKLSDTLEGMKKKKTIKMPSKKINKIVDIKDPEEIDDLHEDMELNSDS